jgi:hypothetical protein
MIIHFVNGVVRTECPSYDLSSHDFLDGNLIKIFIGNKSGVECVIEKEWKLHDSDGNLIIFGKINVKIGRFESYIEIPKIKDGKIYTLSIDNIKTTIFRNVGDIGIIDENHVFEEPIRIFGDLRYYDEKANRVRFSDDWDIKRTFGNGIILAGDRVYAYAPTCIYTYYREAPEFVMFTPLAGMKKIRIEIKQLIKVEKIGYLEYSIDPPTKIHVKFGKEEYFTEDKVSTFSLKNRVIDGKTRLEIRGIYT